MPMLQQVDPVEFRKSYRSMTQRELMNRYNVSSTKLREMINTIVPEEEKVGTILRRHLNRTNK